MRLPERSGCFRAGARLSRKSPRARSREGEEAKREEAGDLPAGCSRGQSSDHGEEIELPPCLACSSSTIAALPASPLALWWHFRFLEVSGGHVPRGRKGLLLPPPTPLSHSSEGEEDTKEQAALLLLRDLQAIIDLAPPVLSSLTQLIILSLCLHPSPPARSTAAPPCLLPALSMPPRSFVPPSLAPIILHSYNAPPPLPALENPHERVFGTINCVGVQDMAVSVLQLHGEAGGGHCSALCKDVEVHNVRPCSTRKRREGGGIRGRGGRTGRDRGGMGDLPLT